MHELFLLIYRQPLQRIIFFMILLIFLWAWMGFRAGRRLWWRLGNGVLFAGVAAVIFYMTVFTRGESASEAILIPFYSFQAAKIQPELYRSMLMNVFLFVPLGLSLPFVLHWRRGSGCFTVLLALAFSAGIEYMQYRYALGLCEVDDVIMNTLGAMIGCQAYQVFRNWERCVLPACRRLAECFRWVMNKLGAE